MRHYCTLADRNYLAKLIAMYRSLERHSSDSFRMHIVAMDDETMVILGELALGQASIYPAASFEAFMGLLPARLNRTWQEFCWTCASSAVEYFLHWHQPDMLTYLDADLFFFSDPEPVFAEIGSRSIAITPHRFPPDQLHMERNGKFNVGWVTFRSDLAGTDCADRWAEQCRAWCFARNEPGRFADQGYLDAWPGVYRERLCIIENIGVNAAPWNIGQYDIRPGESGSPPRLSGVPLICYHLHEYEYGVRLTRYRFNLAARQQIYEPYVVAYAEALAEIEQARSRIQAHQQSLAAQAEWA